MTIEIKHAFTCAVADDPVSAAAGKILPSHWNAALTTSMTTSRLIGRLTAGSGSLEELTAVQVLAFIAAVWNDIVINNTTVKAADNLSTTFPLRVENAAGSAYTKIGAYRYDSWARHIFTVAGSEPTLPSYTSGTDAMVLARNGNCALHITTDNASTGALHFSDSDDRDIGAISYAHSTDTMTFRVNNATRQTIASDGGVTLGSPTGGSQGSGTLNATGLYVNGVAVGGSSAFVQDFRLTLTTGVPVTTSDVTAASTLYCTPYTGNQLSLYTGSAWVTRTSAQFSKALTGLTSGKPYDVFCYDNAGTPTLEFLVWTNDTTRATALAYQDGKRVKSGDATRLFLGTFYTTSTTTTEDSKANRYLKNEYNRVDTDVRGSLVTASRTTTSTTPTELNSETRANFLLFENEAITVHSNGWVYSSGSFAASTMVGIDGTSTRSRSSTVYGTAGCPAISVDTITGIAAGKHYATLLGMVGGGTGTWNVGATGYDGAGVSARIQK